MDALTALARQDAADRRFTAYAADMAWLIVSRLARGRLELDPPSRLLLSPDRGGKPAREDARSGRQIIDDLKAKLLGGDAKAEAEKRKAAPAATGTPGHDGDGAICRGAAARTGGKDNAKQQTHDSIAGDRRCERP